MPAVGFLSAAADSCTSSAIRPVRQKTSHSNTLTPKMGHASSHTHQEPTLRFSLSLSSCHTTHHPGHASSPCRLRRFQIFVLYLCCQ
eukprot:6458846-Amphidinium_carterae.1